MVHSVAPNLNLLSMQPAFSWSPLSQYSQTSTCLSSSDNNIKAFSFSCPSSSTPTPPYHDHRIAIITITIITFIIVTIPALVNCCQLDQT